MSDEHDGPRMADLIDDRSDIPELRERLKEMARRRRQQGGENVKVDDLLAQSRKNDAAYINPSDLEKAEWIADIYRQEGEPEIHPRGFHYQIIGKGYKTRNGDDYVNNNKCWNELKEAFKWARILGLIDSDNIRDNKNGNPTPTSFSDVSRPVPDAELTSTGEAAAGAHVDDGYRSPKFPSTIETASLAHDDAEELIQDAARTVVEQTFEQVYFDAHSQQRYYIEVWSEKSDVIPEEIAAEYGATIRPAGGGEFSLSMCQEAIRIAADRDQDLAIIIVSDFDPKGADMPKSAARKAEIEGALHGVEVELVHGAVTKEQVEAYGIPGDPAKTPDGLEQDLAGAKGYETQKELFRDYAGQHPVEIRAFKSRYPAAFKTELEERLKQYHDADLGDELREAVRAAQQEAYEVLVEAYREHLGVIQDAFDDLQHAIERYHDRLEPHVADAKNGLERLQDAEKQVREQIGVPQKRTQLVNAIERVDHEQVLSNVDVKLPEPDAPGVDEPLLDTRRSLLEQIDAYNDFDVRSR